jgi:hypothetical protein
MVFPNTECLNCTERKCNDCRITTALKLNLIVQCDRCGRRNTPVFKEDLDRGFTRCGCCLRDIKVSESIPKIILKCPKCGKEYKQRFPISYKKYRDAVKHCTCGFCFMKHFYPKKISVGV